MDQQREVVHPFVGQQHVVGLRIVHASNFGVNAVGQRLGIHRRAGSVVQQVGGDGDVLQQDSDAETSVERPYDRLHAKRADVESKHGGPGLQCVFEIAQRYGLVHQQPPPVLGEVRQPELVRGGHEEVLGKELVRQGGEVDVQEPVLVVDEHGVPRVLVTAGPDRGSGQVFLRFGETLDFLALQTGSSEMYVFVKNIYI